MNKVKALVATDAVLDEINEHNGDQRLHVPSVGGYILVSDLVAWFKAYRAMHREGQTTGLSS